MNTISEAYSIYGDKKYTELNNDEIQTLYELLKDNYKSELSPDEKNNYDLLVNLYLDFHYHGERPITVKDLYNKYKNNTEKEIRPYLEDIKEALYNYTIFDIKDREDHINYLEILNKFRNSLFETGKLNGENFYERIQSLLAVGEDGVYKGELRFLFELIQNVDDCDYRKDAERALSIEFYYDSNPGKIILTYDENGFKPRDVFAITGIAEASKNIEESKKKIEIGEKGIGFKSVFGIAYKVHIESGLFSFILEKNHYTEPLLAYENFEGIKGTRLTLYLEPNTCKSLYTKYLGTYVDKNQLLTKNPILFLNKLTSLNAYSKESCLKFEVKRQIPTTINGINKESDIIISSISQSDLSNAATKKVVSVKANRYEKTIYYDKEKCISRYGQKTKLLEKYHSLVMIMPKMGSGINLAKGQLYSFLPTMIETSVPVVLHVPFKLDGSRQFVDTQNKNQWFTHTISELSNFIKAVYLDFSDAIGTNIIRYVPKQENYILEANNLKDPGLQGKTICELPIFLTTSGSKLPASKTVSLDEKLENPLGALNILGTKFELFDTPIIVDMTKYGGHVEKTVPERVFRKIFEVGILDLNKFRNGLQWLSKVKRDVNYTQLFRECSRMPLSDGMVLECLNYPWIKNTVASRLFEYSLTAPKVFPEVVKWLNEDRPEIDYQAIIDQSSLRFNSTMVDTCIEYEWVKRITHKHLFKFAIENSDNFLKIIKALDPINESTYANTVRFKETTWLPSQRIINDIITSDIDWIGRIFSEKIVIFSLNEITYLEKIGTWLENTKIHVNFEDILSKQTKIVLNENTLKVISNSVLLANVFKQYSERTIKKNEQVTYSFWGRSTSVTKNNKPVFFTENNLPLATKEFKANIDNALKNTRVDECFKKYYNDIGGTIYSIDVDENFALATANAIIISSRNESKSFAELTLGFDSDKTLVARLAMQGASKELDDLDKLLSDDTVLTKQSKKKYFKTLIDVRTGMIDSFGEKFIDDFLDLIEGSSTDPNRFLNELIQNADDLKYPENENPEFIAKLDGETFTTYTNEIGFTPRNLRAITSIGESTKKRLLSSDKDYNETGEKGIGFKSIFKIANKVDIHSNGFDFSLTKDHPTIPGTCDSIGSEKGTTMIFNLTEKIEHKFDSEKILQIIACLHRLKHLEILNHTIDINDVNGKRTITFDGIKYVFEIFEEEFDVPETYVKERNINGMNISAKQKIRCYIPEPKSAGSFKNYVYNALPINKHYSKVPAIIDAPFQLTTDRTDIYPSKWSEYIRTKVYDVLFEMIHSKVSEGLNVLRFVGFNSETGFVKNFNSDYMNKGIDWKARLNGECILPVLGSESFVSASSGCVIIPDFIAKLHKKYNLGKILHKNIIDSRNKTRDMLALLQFIGVSKINGSQIYDILREIVTEVPINKDFRDDLYGFLSSSASYFEKIPAISENLPIVPITSSNGGTEYIVLPKKIYYTETRKPSDQNHKILDTDIMSLDIYDEIYKHIVRIELYDERLIRAEYRENLEETIKSIRNSDEDKAKYLLKEYSSNPLFKCCESSVRGLKDMIPTLMQGKKDGESYYKKGNRFFNNSHIAFKGKFIPSLIVQEDYIKFAEYIGFNSDILVLTRESIDITVPKLTDEDIEDLQEGFTYFGNLIKDFIKEGAISQNQIEKYRLEFADPGNDGSEDEDEDDWDDEEFPMKPVVNRERLKSRIEQAWNNHNPYVDTYVLQWNPLQPIDDEKVSYSKSNYSTTDRTKCFCQMCKKKFHASNIQREEIESEPAYAWKQMWLTLCLQCAKEFEIYKRNDYNKKAWIRLLLEADVGYKDSIDIEFKEKTITFTGIHLADVQEILRIEKYPNSPEKRKQKYRIIKQLI